MDMSTYECDEQRRKDDAAQAGKDGKAVADPADRLTRVELCARVELGSLHVREDIEVATPEPDARLDVAVLTELVPADEADCIR
jgi:hypothetical protein